MCKPVVRKITGFSLLEILVVLALLSIAMLIVPPMFSSGVSSAEMKSSARKIVRILRKERSAAILSRKVTVFSLNVNNKTYQSKQLIKPAQIPQGLSVAFTTGESLVNDDRASGQINFYPDGSSTGGRITLKRDNQTAMVDVEWLTGKVSLHE